MADNVSAFMSLTGADSDTATFYLESAGGNIEEAINQYFEGGSQPQRRPSPAPTPAPAPRTSSPVPAATPLTRPTPAPAPSSSSRPKAPASSGGRIKTFSELVGGDDSDEEEEGQAFYAGGEKSGIQQIVPGQPIKDDHNRRMTDNVLRAAKERGAQDYEEYMKEQEENRTFSGAGYRLGHTQGPSTPVAGTTKKPPKMVTITMWKSGFTVDDGPHRLYTEPASRDFMEQVERGRVPRELFSVSGGSDITVNLADRRADEYTPPPKKFAAFVGSGRSLGSASASSSTPAPRPTAAPEPRSAGYTVDESQPTTSIQVRMHDGTRMVAKFNLSHTVGDLRRFVRAASPSVGQFQLMLSMPRKVLDNDSATIQEAGLANSVVIQKV